MDDIVSIQLPYGNTSIPITLPRKNLLAVVDPTVVPGATDVVEVVRRAVRHPVDRPPLDSMIKPGQNVLIIVDDNTRPTPVHQVLPSLLKELDVARKRLRVRILIAAGTHRAMTPEEIQAKVGADVVAHYEVLNHRWDDESALVDLGVTPAGTPIKINRLVMDADFVIAIGTTVPHCLAGWAGGAKIIQPGVSGEDTTNATHALTMVSPMPHLGRMDNPMRVEIDQIVKQVKLDFMLCCVLNQNAQIVDIVAGDTLAAHRRSVELASKIWVRPVPALADVVVVSSYPSDVDYWQGIKGLFAAELIVKRGGDVLLATPCPEGIAGTKLHEETMVAVAGIPSREMRIRAQELGLTDLTGLNTAVVAARINELCFVSVYSDGLTDEQLRALGHTRARSVQEGLDLALKRQGPNAKVLVITHGGDTCPVLAM
jgi:nickel-dependent lactate racemase